jgi:spermidine/putrescine transport system substrate-binding protein
VFGARLVKAGLTPTLFKIERVLERTIAMRWMMMILVVAVVMVGGGIFSPVAMAGEEITVFMWSKYIDPEIPKQFEKETGIKVNIAVYESTDDALAKLKAGGGDSLYDVVVVSNEALRSLVALSLVQPLDKQLIPNAANVDETFKKPVYDPGSKFSVPYQWGTVGIVYDKTKIKPPTSWKAVLDPASQPGKVVMVDSMRDMIGSTLIANGKSANATAPKDLRDAGHALIAAKKSPKTIGFEGSVGVVSKVAAGEAALGVCYNGDALQAQGDGSPNLAFVVPDEGGILWVDLMCVPSKAPNAKAGQKFINYLLDGKVGAKLSNFNRYASPNKASMPDISAEDKKDPAIYPDAQKLQKLEMLKDLGPATRIYDEIWTGVKTR